MRGLEGERSKLGRQTPREAKTPKEAPVYLAVHSTMSSPSKRERRLPAGHWHRVVGGGKASKKIRLELGWQAKKQETFRLELGA